MSVFLERIDSLPFSEDEFTFEVEQWLTALVDTLNAVIEEIEGNLNANENGLELPVFTQAEIIGLAATAQDGTMWYCSDNPQVVVKINGALRQLDTSAFP